MLRFALIFAIFAILSGLLGFMVLEGALAWLAKACLLIFLVLFVVSLLFGGSGRNPASRSESPK